ncbi:entry exclusion protein 1 [Klebsiella pneumoniae]|nr:entry exclusion protein 1 [Klebsiella pneumoniae]
MSELIRVYGNVNIPEKQIPGISHRENTQKFPTGTASGNAKELADLRQAVTLMLEDKTSREEERRQHDDERRKLQAEVDRLTTELTQKKKRFWSGWFS